MANISGGIAKELKLFLLMVFRQVVAGGVNIFYKLATIDGMHVRILIVYRLLFAVAFTVPLALVFERGALGNNLNAEGVVFTSATFASSISNLMPAITFILAIIFRLESLAIQTLAGKAKVLRTVLEITGAMVLTLYKGSKINIWSTHTNVLQYHHDVAASQRASSILCGGPFMCTGSSLSFAIWLTIQTKMNERYPLHTSIALMNTSGAIQAGVYAMCTEKNRSAWKLGWDIRLLSATYCGTAGSVFLAAVLKDQRSIMRHVFLSLGGSYLLRLLDRSFSTRSCIWEGGFYVIKGSITLKSDFHVYDFGVILMFCVFDSVIGSVLIIGGLYTVLWGKREELKMAKSAVPVRSETSVSNGDKARCIATVRIKTVGNSDTEASAAMEEAKTVTS